MGERERKRKKGREKERRRIEREREEEDRNGERTTGKQSPRKRKVDAFDSQLANS